MTSPLYEQILELQSTDIKIRQLNHKHTNHELRAKLASAISDAASKKIELDEAVLAVEQNNAEQRKIQHRVAELETKREASQTKLYSGSVTAANELMALEDEVRGFKAKQDGFEDDLLELMEQAENLNVIETASKQQYELAEQTVAETESLLATALQEIADELEQRSVERQNRADVSDPELLRRYEELVPLYDGVTVARLVNGGCDGCHIQLSAVALDQIDRLDESAVVTCEECGRLLVR